MLAIPKLIQIRRCQGSSCKIKDEALELIAFHKEATGFEYATWLGNSNCKGITKEQLYLGISVVLRQIGNGSQNHQKDATKEVKCKSK